MEPEREAPRRAVIVDIDIPFFTLMWRMVQWLLAAVPATIVAAIIWAFVVAALAGVNEGLRRPVHATYEPPPMPHAGTGVPGEGWEDAIALCRRTHQDSDPCMLRAGYRYEMGVGWVSVR